VLSFLFHFSPSLISLHCLRWKFKLLILGISKFIICFNTKTPLSLHLSNFRELCFHFYLVQKSWAGHWWLTPVILATWKGLLRKWFLKSHLENNQSKTDWRWGICDRVPALHIRNPESNPSPTKKKKKKF
jgi:hypothetical protein